jgi:alpha,alpha-trehalose phosphorylase
MEERDREGLPRHIYPPEEWRLVEKAFAPRYVAQMETVFATSNGYLGIRGAFEERAPVFQPGTFVNGFHETWPIVYGEEAYGFARTGQTMLNLADARLIRLFVDDEPLHLPTARLESYERAIDFRSGTLDRDLTWETPAGKRVRVRSRRLVSLENRHLAAILYEVTLLDATAPLALSSEVAYTPPGHLEEWDPRGTRAFEARPLVPAHHSSGGRRLLLAHRTVRSGMRVACAVEHLLETGCHCEEHTESSEDAARFVLTVDGQPGETVRLVKLITYHTSRSAPVEDLCDRAERTLDRARTGGFAAMEDGQRAFMDRFWHRADIELQGDTAVQQVIRWNLFQLLQATARAEGAGVGARGLTGETYEGHYFWDAEIYVMPFLLYTEPRIARNLLRFRYSMLEKARERAREVGEEGALFPWRTINGEEASAYYAAGTAQYHINADIAHAIRRYAHVTGDRRFLHGPGAEMLVETARMWRSLGFFSERKGGRFEIHAVTGPDEYATVVNNNTFTNLMARENLRYAAEVVERMRNEDPGAYAHLVHAATHLASDETEGWRQAAERMHVPYDEELGIHPQDDAFLRRERWDFEGTPRERYPLLLHFHPLVIYRHQVIKQADVVLALFLLNDEFTAEEKRRNFEYYDPLTTGDSSLSASIQAIIAMEIGDREKAWRYFRHAALMDLADLGGNVKDGAHIASIGGTWLAVVHGMAGFRDDGDRPLFRPRVPQKDIRLRMRLTLDSSLLEIQISKEEVRYEVLEGDALEILHHDEPLRLEPRHPLAR